MGARRTSKGKKRDSSAFTSRPLPPAGSKGRPRTAPALPFSTTRLARSGVPMAVAQKLTGHRSIAILLQVYTHVRDAESRKAIEGLPSIGVVGNVETTSDGAERAQSSAAPS